MKDKDNNKSISSMFRSIASLPRDIFREEVRKRQEDSIRVSRKVWKEILKRRLRGEKITKLDLYKESLRQKKDDILNTYSSIAAPSAASALSLAPMYGVNKRNFSAGAEDVNFVNSVLCRGKLTDPRVKDILVGDKPLKDFVAEKGLRLNDAQEFGLFKGPHYSPASKTINVGFNPKASKNAVKGVVGHELGHAVRHVDRKLKPALYGSSKALSTLLGGLGILRNSSKFTDDREAAAWSALTALSAAPVLHEEFNASRIGSKLVGLKGLKRLHSFRGLPSYLAFAGAPAIAFGTRKLLEKRNKSKDKK